MAKSKSSATIGLGGGNNEEEEDDEEDGEIRVEPLMDVNHVGVGDAHADQEAEPRVFDHALDDRPGRVSHRDQRVVVSPPGRAVRGIGQRTAERDGHDRSEASGKDDILGTPLGVRLGTHTLNQLARHRRIHDRMRRGQDLFVRRIAGDEDLAQDYAQEAWIRAIRALPTFRGDSRFSTWLHRIAVNAA